MNDKDTLILHGMAQQNTIGAFQTRNRNTPAYNIVQWTGKVYTLQEK